MSGKAGPPRDLSVKSKIDDRSRHSEYEGTSRFQTTGGRNLLHDDLSLRGDVTSSSPAHPTQASATSSRRGDRYEYVDRMTTSRASDFIDLRSPPGRMPLQRYHPKYEASHGIDSHGSVLIDSHVDGTDLDGPLSMRGAPLDRRASFMSRGSSREHYLASSRNKRPRPISETESKDGLAPVQDGPDFQKGTTRGIDHSFIAESNDFRRSRSVSPIKQMMSTGHGTTDGTSHTRLSIRDGINEKRSLTPELRHLTPRSSIMTAHPIQSEYRPSAGPVASFFSHPPSRQSNRHAGFATPPLTSRSLLADGPRYHHTQLLPSDSRAASPPHSRPRSQAWFAIDGPPHPRDLSAWSPGHIRSYDIGFDDAIRAVERGVVGIGNVQLDRHPLLVRREISPETIPPPRGYSREAYRDAYPVRTPTTSVRPPHQEMQDEVRLYSRRDHPTPLLPLNPHAVSPYEFGYGHPYYHHSAPPHRDGRYDPYSDRHVHHLQGTRGPARSQRQLISCYPCRSRKLKCDGEKPCAQCKRRGSEDECAYATHVRRRGKGKKASEGGESSGEGSQRGGTADGEKWGSIDSLETPRYSSHHLPDGEEENKFRPTPPSARSDAKVVSDGQGEEQGRDGRMEPKMEEVVISPTFESPTELPDATNNVEDGDSIVE